MDYNSDKIEIFKSAVDVGCCKRCALRFIDDDNTDYNSPETTLNQLGLSENNVNKNEECEQLIKRIRTNSCTVCLDVLEDSTIADMLSNRKLQEVLQYDSTNFVNYVSLPVSVLIREHSIEVYLKNKFPNYFKDHHIIPINRAWTLAIQNKLAKLLDKKYDKTSNLLIQFNTIYEREGEELAVLQKLDTKLKSAVKHENISRNVVVELLKEVDEELFKKHVTIPPDVSTTGLQLHEIIYNHEPIFVAGRYCKYSRNLGQSPWVIDNVKIVENSVQEIIFKPFEDLFNFKTLIFSASGREDFDVRTLGRGRPFFIKISDPKTTKITFKQFRDIENEIKKSKLVQVRDLQSINKKDLTHIKDGEQFKKKHYRTLCVIDKPESREDYINKINETTTVKLNQKTPIRVFHRRSSSTRLKEIYSMKARPVVGRDNLIEVDLLTQAGTYVKEFVHGDLGRTKPSLGAIIGGNVDILALDVLDIQLDFPPSINYDEIVKMNL